VQYVDVPTVSCRLVVIDPSCCLSVVMCAVRFVFREAILCIAFHGLVTEVILQNSFQDFLSSHLMAAAYSALDTRYCTFLPSHCSGFSFVPWYLRLFAFTSFLCNVRHEFQHGTDLCRGSFLDVSLVCLNEDRHA